MTNAQQEAINVAFKGLSLATQTQLSITDARNLMPELGHGVHFMQWKKAAQTLLEECPFLSQRNKIRLLMKVVRNVPPIKTQYYGLLEQAMIDDEGDFVNAFWDWYDTHYELTREEKVSKFSNAVTGNVIGEGFNPAEAIQFQLAENDLSWTDVAVDEKLRNIVGNTMLRDANYLNPVELFARGGLRWYEYVTEQWREHHQDQEGLRVMDWRLDAYWIKDRKAKPYDWKRNRN